MRAYPRSWSRDFRPVHEADHHLQSANHVVPHTDQHLFLNIAHKGFPSNCQNLQIRRAFKEILLLMAETYSQLNFTQKIVVKLFQQLVTECTDQYRLYSLVHLLQQPVTEELMEKNSTELN